MVTCGILAVITVAVNSSVLCVLWSYKNLSKHSQSYYRVSLAFADLLVGLIVFPTCISTLYYRLVAQLEINFVKSNDQPTVAFKPSLSQHYLSVIGVFTTLSLAASLLTLALAGFDRLNAIRNPLNYNRVTAAKQAKWLLTGIWILGFIIATLPLFTPGLYPYSLIVGLIAATREEHALLEYLIGLGLPFLAVWISVIVICCAIKKQRRFARTLSQNSKSTFQKEQRVYKILFCMLSAFTLSLAPTIIAVFAQGDRRILEHQADVYDPDLAASWSSFELFAALLFMCNSLWNFFIYSYQDSTFRNMAKNKYKAICRSCLFRKNLHPSSFIRDNNPPKTSIFSLNSSRRSSATESESKTDIRLNFRGRFWSVFSNKSDV